MSENPKQCCDLVMKGGITSGVLYPPAIVEIARSFHLVGIGGTSAGAIAAAAAAAAEYRRRQTGSFRGYELLAEVPDRLADDGRLRELFRPDKETRKLFNFALSFQGFGEKSWLGKGGKIASVAWKLLHADKTFGPFIANGYGVTSGMANGNRPKKKKEKVPPISIWLADLFDEIAGLGPGEGPLTFRHLHEARRPESELGEEMARGSERSIDLRMVATRLSHGLPLELPSTSGEFGFDPAEWRRLFPERIVDHLVAWADKEGEKRRERGKKPSSLDRENKRPLTLGPDLPVVAAVRMSLSFPALFSLMPLWGVDFQQEPDAAGNVPLERVWVADGGITSNLPNHIFDRLVPRWPTMVMNLQYTAKDDLPRRKNTDEDFLYMTKERGRGRRPLWRTFGGEGALTKLGAFAGTIFASAQTWHDYSYFGLPSYTDRAVEVWLKSAEGGFNLDMDKETILALKQRGAAAGRRLVQRFSADARPNEDSIDWESHRWVRLRMSLESLGDALLELEESLRHPMPGDSDLRTFLDEVSQQPGHPMTKKQALAAREALDQLLDWTAALRAGDRPKGESHVFGKGPRAKARLALRAPL